MAQAPQPPQDPAGDPSMEDILASIRRILSEEEQGGEAKLPTLDEPEPAPSHDVLLLNEDMMVPESAPLPTPALAPEHEPEPVPAPAPVAPPEPAVDSAPLPSGEPAPVVTPTPVLVAPEAAQAAASSLGALVRTLAQERGTAVRTGGPTIEDLVREEVRPILKVWLDAHLPPLVERLVRAEIARVVGQVNL